jgi:hypothetical protein
LPKKLDDTYTLAITEPLGIDPPKRNIHPFTSTDGGRIEIVELEAKVGANEGMIVGTRAVGPRIDGL